MFARVAAGVILSGQLEGTDMRLRRGGIVVLLVLFGVSVGRAQSPEERGLANATEADA